MADGIEGEIVVLAIPYTEAPHVVREYDDQLGGTVVVDPTNPAALTRVEPLDRDWIAPFGSAGQPIAAEATPALSRRSTPPSPDRRWLGRWAASP